IGNDFLVKNPGFDFFMDISSKKTISLRANNKIDVSKMASDIFGGGGHANASGGVMPSFKEAYAYEAVKDQVQAYINQKLNETK
ncbi:MAG: DHHA1 domain-containing protein, partial [Campylobacter sp.]|nr:DHHA1 domain-containing protein [Campylobacter sp.]